MSTNNSVIDAEREINSIVKSIKQIDLVVKKEIEKSSNFPRIIILGSTGVSKSTLANCIIGNQLKIKQNEYDNLYLSTEKNEFPMGDTMQSKTSIPNIYADQKHKCLICDMPGFCDNRGTMQEIIDSFSIDQIFCQPCQIKILFVFSAYEASIDGRGFLIKKNIERIQKILPNNEELMNSIGIVITRGDGRSPDKYLRQLIDSNPNEELVHFINFFLQNLNERVFSLPQASRNHVGDNYIFHDYSRLMHFIQQSPVQNPTHKIILSENALIEMNTVANMFGNIESLIKDLFITIKQNFGSNIDNLETLRYLLYTIRSKLTQNLSPIDFVNIVEDQIKEENFINSNLLMQIEPMLNQIKCFNSLYSFVKNIDDCNKIIEIPDICQKAQNVLIDEIESAEINIAVLQSESEIEMINQQIGKLESDIHENNHENQRLERHYDQLYQQMIEDDEETEQQIDRLNSLIENQNQILTSNQDESLYTAENIINFIDGFLFLIDGTTKLYKFLKSRKNNDNDDDNT